MSDLKEKSVVGKMKSEFETCNRNKVRAKALHLARWCVTGSGASRGNCQRHCGGCWAPPDQVWLAFPSRHLSLCVSDGHHGIIGIIQFISKLR
jgi:hypothetical protein